MKNDKNISLAFYTVYFGDDNGNSNKIPVIPTKKYDCYYFTNNKNTYNRLKNTIWKSVFVDIPIKTDLNDNIMDAKHPKACPHKYNELKKYKYTCYFDSKMSISCMKTEEIINKYIDKFPMLVTRHSFLLPNVYNEYNECLKQKRYRIQKDQYMNYIEKQISRGLLSESDNHFETGYIVRDMEKTIDINEMWYEHILECGMECQISFFFIGQIFKDKIKAIDEYMFNKLRKYKIRR